MSSSHTTHGTVVWPESRRSSPTCWKQNPFTLFASDGLKPVHGVAAAGCFTPFATKICRGESASVSPPSFSSHMIQGTGSLPAIEAPPATEGFSAVRFVWMLSDGMRRPSTRSWPDGSHAFAPALKRLAKMFVGSPKWKFGSYHATQGTVRPAPAKSIDGASASTVGSMLSDSGEPCVTHAPFLKARTKICWESPIFCSNVAQGTWTLPATKVPPATSTRPASCFRSMEFAASSLTWAPLDGSDTKAADAGGAETSVPPSIVARPRVQSVRFIRDLLSRPGSDGCVWPLYAQVPAADDGGLGVAGACRYGRGTVARTVGGVMVLCLLVASVGRGDEGGGWRDRVTLIASERLRGEVVDWFRPRPGAAEPEASRYAFVASQLRAGLSVVLPHAQLTLVAH